MGSAAGVTPAYWDEACRHLTRRDRVMKRLIPLFGQARLQSRGDAFTTLARSIVGQQISVKAAQAVWDRLVAQLHSGEHAGEQASPGKGTGTARRENSEGRGGARDGSPDSSRDTPRDNNRVGPKSNAIRPEGLLRQRVDDLRAAGLSARKVEYLCDLAMHFCEQKVHVADWDAMDDETIIGELVAIRGIGRWTAEMFLIFHLMRPNIMPLDDLGLIKGISLNYFSGEPVSRSEAREVGEAWSPYRSVATWYLWRSLDPLPVEY